MEKQGWPQPDDWLHTEPEEVTTPLTREEERILSENGLDLDLLPDDGPYPVDQGHQQFLRLVKSGSFGEAEVARNLNCSIGSIERSIANRRLFAIWHQSQWRVPKFQFTQGRQELIPGIQEVNMRVPADWHPIGIENWYSQTNSDLEMGEESLSPLEWLRSRREPKRLHRMAEVLDYPL